VSPGIPLFLLDLSGKHGGAFAMFHDVLEVAMQ
jgi:hypothetical protein